MCSGMDTHTGPLIGERYNMKWLSDYQLFLFDFDGLLVNTEEISLFVQTYIGHLDMIAPFDTTMSIQCNYKYSNDKFSCHLFQSHPRYSGSCSVVIISCQMTSRRTSDNTMQLLHLPHWVSRLTDL